jgi:hypothetical protein
LNSKAYRFVDLNAKVIIESVVAYFYEDFFFNKLESEISWCLTDIPTRLAPP